MRAAERLLVAQAAAAGALGYLAALRLALRLSPRVAAYRGMSREEQLEWNSRVPSTLHALAITAAAAYLFLGSPVFSADHAGDAPFVLRTSPASAAALGLSLGYFLADLAGIAAFWPTFGGAEMALHHVAALASVSAAAVQGHGHAYTLALLATECTTPLVNLRYYLDKGGWRSHPAYTANGMALLLSWMVARILLFVKFFHHLSAHLHEFPAISPLSRALIYTVPPTLFALNVVWFWKIAKGAIKLILPSGRSTAQRSARSRQAASKGAPGRAATAVTAHAVAAPAAAPAPAGPASYASKEL